MFFKKSKFFLDLTGEDSNSSGKEVAKVVVAPVAPVAAPAPKSTPAPKTAVVAATEALAAVSSTDLPTPGAVSSGVRTTAEEIAAELAAAQANRPAASTVTFAPDRLVPGGTLARNRRTGGANLAGFREIARSMMKS